MSDFQEIYQSSEVIRAWVRILKFNYRTVTTTYLTTNDLIEDIQLCQALQDEPAADSETLLKLIQCVFRSIGAQK